jgi:DNA invertase Pin-like site-specific DNA recombinase
MLAFPVQLRDRSAGLRMLIPGGEGIDTPTPRGSTVFTDMAALAQTELEIKANASPTQWRQAGSPVRTWAGDAQRSSPAQIRRAVRLIEAGESATQMARDLGMSRAILYRRMRHLPQPTS